MHYIYHLYVQHRNLVGFSSRNSQRNRDAETAAIIPLYSLDKRELCAESDFMQLNV